MTRSPMVPLLRFTDQDEDKPTLKVSRLPNLKLHSLALHYTMMRRHVILANSKTNLIHSLGDFIQRLPDIADISKVLTITNST